MSVPINICYQLLLFFSGNLSLSLLSGIIFRNHFEFLADNLERGRILVDTYNEIVTPHIVNKKLKSKQSIFISVLVISLIGFNSYVSNFRTRILMFSIGLLGSSLLNIKSKKNYLLLTILALAFLAYIANSASNRLYNTSFIERFTLQKNDESVESIISRSDQILTSMEMGKASFFGIGLGNYYDNLLKKNSGLEKSNSVTKGAQEYVHNVFASIIAETGYFSLLLFLILLYLFARNDIAILKSDTDHRKTFVISFWTLFSFSVFNPSIPGAYQFLYWGLRGLLLERL